MTWLYAKVYRRAITDELRLYGELHRFIVVLAEGVCKVTELETHHRPRCRFPNMACRGP